PRLHQHGERGARLDGVHAHVVGDLVQPREVVGVGEAAVGAEQAERLVLDGRDDLLAAGVHLDVAALDHAPRHALVRLPASAPGGILSRSSTIAFTFLRPSTAPTPPRAASREGRRSLSVNAMPAMSPWYSPTGPQSAVATFLPYFSSSIRFASQLPLPRSGRPSAKSMVPSFLQ